MDLRFTYKGKIEGTGHVLHDLHFEIEHRRWSMHNDQSQNDTSYEQVGFIQVQVLDISLARQLLRRPDREALLAGAAQNHLKIALLFGDDGTLLNPSVAWNSDDFIGNVNVLWIKRFEWTTQRTTTEQREAWLAYILPAVFNLEGCKESEPTFTHAAILLVEASTIADNESSLCVLGFRRVGNSSIFGLSRNSDHQSRAVRATADARFMTQPVLVPR
ncbi:hypothetical protein C8F01DRAFT_1180984, partial [Mycena amicta]